ncbi:MAG: hypothetical protein K0Q59_357 [Paenibacillus sp.]|nr:hypothetical protein [Paenibacillus sp.]
MIRVFVYGTLLQGESNYGIVAPFVVQIEPGAVRGELFDAGEYPAIVVSDADGCCESQRDAGAVAGEWLTVREQALAAMDELELYYGPGDARNDYERIVVHDIDGIRCGWAYVWNDSRGCVPIRSGNWRSR